MGWGGGALKAAVDIPRRGETRGRKIISTSVGRGKGGGGRSSKMAFFVGYVAPLARSATAAKDTDDLFIFLWELEEKEEGEAERKIYESREGGKGGRGKEREEEEAGGKNIFQFSDERSLNANRAAGVEEGRERKRREPPSRGGKLKTFFLSGLEIYCEALSLLLTPPLSWAAPIHPWAEDAIALSGWRQRRTKQAREKTLLKAKGPLCCLF